MHSRYDGKMIKSGGRRTLRVRTVIPAMLAVLAFALVLATGIGTVSVPFLQTLKIILKHCGLPVSINGLNNQESIIFYVRFPEVLTAMLVGAALAACGAVMQGMFRNPMADPSIIGVSSGAGLGAVIAIALGLAGRSLYFMPLFAAAGAIAAATAIFLIASRNGKIPTLTLILAGIAVSTFIGAITQIILTVIADYQVHQFVFWTMGGLDSRRWEHVRLVLPVVVLIFILFAYARDLNVMLLGEEEAQAVGLSPSRTRKTLLFLTAFTTAIAVSVSGGISFVGLIVPHIMRLIVGPDHRILLPASAVGGAIFLVLCDLISRTAVPNTILGVGIVTALIGAPYFLHLIFKARRREGGI